MSTPVFESIRQWRKKQRYKGKRRLILFFDNDSFERFDRLKDKIPALDSKELIGSALKCLEQKTDKIIMRQVMKKIRALKNDGLSPQQIADILNEKEDTSVEGMDKWDSETVASLLRREEGNTPTVL